MRVYYQNELNSYGFHTIIRTWGGNQGRPRPEDLAPSPLDGTYNFIEVDALVNRKLCAELARGWMPKPHFQVTGAYDPAESLPDYYVNTDSLLCNQDGTLVEVVTDEDKDIIEGFPVTLQARAMAKSARMGLNEPEITVESLQEELDELKEVVNSIIARNSLAEWKG